MESLWKLLYLLEPAPVTLITTAVAVTFGSAFRALNYGKEMERNRDLSEASITLDRSQALMIPVMSSFSQGQAGLVPLQSAEVFDSSTDTWSHVPSMPFSRAQVLPSVFLADMLKPIATGLTSYMGKLCVPQSLYSWPFFC